MDNRAVFTKTAKGLSEAVGKTKTLSRNMGNVLKEVNGTSSVEELLAKLVNLSENEILEALAKLANQNYIREFSSPHAGDGLDDDLDFDFTLAPGQEDPLTALTIGAFYRALPPQEAPGVPANEAGAPIPGTLPGNHMNNAPALATPSPEQVQASVTASADRVAAKGTAKSKAGAVDLKAQKKARLEAEAQAKIEAEEKERRRAAIAKIRQDAIEKYRQDLEERAKKEAEDKRYREAEALAIQKAQQARIEAETKAKHEAEVRAKAEAEARAKAEAEAKAKREAEARAKAEAQARAKAEAEAKAKREAEARAKAEAQARAKAEAEAKAKREAEARAKAEAEARAKAEAEARAKAEAEARARAEAETKAKREAEARAKAEVRAKQQAEQIRKEAAEQAKREAEEASRRYAEEAQMKAERQAKKDAERKAKQEAQAQAKREAEQRAQQKAEEKARRQAEKQAEREAKESARLAAAASAQQQGNKSDRQEPSLGDASAGPKAASTKAGEIRTQKSLKAWILGHDTDEEAGHEKPVKKDVFTEKPEPFYSAKQRNKHYRKPVQWGKPVILAVFSLLAAGIVATQTMSFEQQLQEFEALASNQFQQPVKIGSVQIGLLPFPHWQLKEVSIGTEGQIKAPQVKAFPRIDTLLEDKPVYQSLSLVSPRISEEGLGWLMFSQSEQRNLWLRKIRASNARLESSQIDLPAFDAEITMGMDGNWKKMVLDAATGNLHLEFHPGDDAIQIAMKADSFTPPFGAGFALKNFRASGTVQRDSLTLAKFNGGIMNGSVYGNAKLQWGANWTLTGDISAMHIPVSPLAPQLFESGQLEGKANYTLQAAKASQLLDDPRLKGSISIRNGVLLGVDLGDVLRAVRIGGKSPFTEFESKLSYEGGNVKLRNIHFVSGVVSAKGNAEMNTKNKLSGRFDVALKASFRQSRAHVSLVGTRDTPLFESRKCTSDCAAPLETGITAVKNDSAVPAPVQINPVELAPVPVVVPALQ